MQRQQTGTQRRPSFACLSRPLLEGNLHVRFTPSFLHNTSLREPNIEPSADPFSTRQGRFVGLIGAYTVGPGRRRLQPPSHLNMRTPHTPASFRCAMQLGCLGPPQTCHGALEKVSGASVRMRGDGGCGRVCMQYYCFCSASVEKVKGRVGDVSVPWQRTPAQGYACL